MIGKDSHKARVAVRDAVLTAALCTLASNVAAGVTSSPLSLGPDGVFEGSLAGGEEATFELDLAGGRPWRVIVDQEGIDLVVSLLPAGGGELLTVDSPFGRHGPETLVVVPAVSGPHVLRLRPAAAQAVRGGFRVEVSELDGDSEPARLRRQAERAVSEAGRRFALETPEASRQAASFYEQALELWRRLGDRRGQALALTALGALARRQSQPRLALSHLGQALELWRAEGDRRRAAIALNDLGLSRLELGDRAEAKVLLGEAAALHAAIGEVYGEAVARSNLCLLLLSEGAPASARPCFERTVDLFAAAGERHGEALARNGLAGVFDKLGEPSSALEELGRAYRLVHELGDRRGQARLLANRAALYRRVGEMRSALADYGRVVPVLRELGDRRWLARTLNNLGFVYLELGEPERARGLLEQSLELRLAVGDRTGEAVTRNSLGRAHRQLGEPAAAVEAHREALALLADLDDRERLATTHGQLGQAFLDLGDARQALADFERALELLGASGERRRRGQVLIGQASALLRLGDAAAARRCVDEALALMRSLEDPAGVALAEAASARTHLASGNPEAALAAVDSALAHLESLRQRVAGPDLRAAFLDSRFDAYQLKVELLMARHRAEPEAGFDRAALAAVERSRARVLRDLLETADSRLGIDPELRDRRQDLQRRLRAQENRRLKLQEAGRPGDAEVAGREVDAVLVALDLLEGEIERGHPGFAGLIRGPSFDLAGTQAELGDAVLLEYALGEQRSTLWRVTATTFESFVLPPRSRLESAARAAFLELRAITAGAARRPAVGVAADLLVGPVADRLDGGKLLIVPDGALHYLPFGALPLPAGEPMASEHEIAYLPSATVLTALRRPPEAARSLSVAVLADPVFGPGDPRLEGVPRSVEDDPRGDAFARLPATRREAEAIAAVLPAGEVEVAAGFDADLEALRAGRWRRHRILHLATHGVIDARYPGRSGVVLSRFDSQGRERPGFLGLRDLYDLRLEADLVVLSGCETAIGRELKGEGLVGLSRGFMYSGAPRVVATLWRVEDRVTAQWMAIFYRELLERRRSPPAALRAAQLEIRSRHAWRHPYYWAAFVLIGDWRDLERDPS